MSAPPDPRDAARARLAAVRERFAARLAARVTELLDQIARARVEESDLSGSIALAHRLAGTAGSYGYDEAGEHAAVVESVLRRIASATEAGRKGADADAAWAELDAAVESLKSASPPG